MARTRGAYGLGAFHGLPAIHTAVFIGAVCSVGGVTTSFYTVDPARH